MLKENIVKLAIKMPTSSKLNRNVNRERLREKSTLRIIIYIILSGGSEQLARGRQHQKQEQQ